MPGARSASKGVQATLACLWEATAPKPGNVYRGADFDDLTYADFVTSAAVIGPILNETPPLGVGATVLAAVAATRDAVGTNTNLGMMLLITPLAAAAMDRPLSEGVAEVLRDLSVEDANQVYAAIRLAQPGGLGRVDNADVNAPEALQITLREAMALAAGRDLVARQYVNDFAEVRWTADRIAAAATEQPLGEAIVRAYLELLAKHPDSLVARKCGPEVATQVSAGAATVLAALPHGEDAYHASRAEFDFWLRAEGNRRNPGTSADLIAAALFTLLREQRIKLPVRFY
ncbi:MAG: triphosphoribosyl-dephospho-CoA synthase [Pirellulales bacterium]|nr:triphosphoribosyl-dephospho-CoA synthase [Pirellulales bacterium]